MATPDHKAPARASFPQDAHLNFLPDSSHSAWPAKRTRSDASSASMTRLAPTLTLIGSVRCLRAPHLTWHHAAAALVARQVVLPPWPYGGTCARFRKLGMRRNESHPVIGHLPLVAWSCASHNPDTRTSIHSWRPTWLWRIRQIFDARQVRVEAEQRKPINHGGTNDLEHVDTP